MRRRQNFAFFPPFFFAFLPSLFFFFCWALIGFISVGKVFGKAFRILGLDERKGKWVVEQEFYGNFGSMLHTSFFAFAVRRTPPKLNAREACVRFFLAERNLIFRTLGQVPETETRDSCSCSQMSCPIYDC